MKLLVGLFTGLVIWSIPASAQEKNEVGLNTGATLTPSQSLAPVAIPTFALLACRRTGKSSRKPASISGAEKVERSIQRIRLGMFQSLPAICLKNSIARVFFPLPSF